MSRTVKQHSCILDLFTFYDSDGRMLLLEGKHCSTVEIQQHHEPSLLCEAAVSQVILKQLSYKLSKVHQEFVLLLLHDKVAKLHQTRLNVLGISMGLAYFYDIL